MNSQTMVDFQKLCVTVQKNCHISDGWHAQDYSLCTYLLKMRELYRWEKKLPLTAQLPKEDVSQWLMGREQLWENLAQEPLVCLPINNHCYDPFDVATINTFLLPEGFIYGGGYGKFCKPSFFMGRLSHRQQQENIEILIVDEECARDFDAPVAMSQGRTIFIRRESVRRNLWETIENTSWKKPHHELARILELYHFNQMKEPALDKMTEDNLETMISHETGEIYAGHLLGEHWESMLVCLAKTQAELIARAVRDHLADCLVTLPKLLENNQETSLLFYFIHFKGLRKEIFPALQEAYQTWLGDHHKVQELMNIVIKGQEHWLQRAQTLLEIHRTSPKNSVHLIPQLSLTL